MNRLAGTERHNKILVRVDPDLADLIPGFLNNRQKDIQALTEAVRQDQFDIIRTIGHKMRGDGGGYGFHDITNIGAAFEQAAKEKNSAEIRRRIVELSAYLKRIEVVYG